jgi:lipopolysaccharide transport system ATP-binding protein
MSDTVIKVENLSKQYRIGAKEGYRTFRETLIDSAKAPFLLCRDIAKKVISPLPSAGRSEPKSEENTIWALKDVSFEVKQGEVVGIIGRNGAGKSTLLKVLSKITEPTEGRLELRGRVGSLLEVGTGFHPELTGHENVYLYGAILGMDRWEVTRKFDEIIAFAELEKFVDTPVKRYSSGMYMRLAFAVAAHLEPEILLIDEVLAVGDTKFQKKCIGKMDDVSKEGRTVLFVSHNMGAVSNLCKDGIIMEEGQIIFNGDINVAITRYLERMEESTLLDFSKRRDRRGTGLFRFTRLRFENNNGKAIEMIRSGQDFKIIFDYESNQEKELLSVKAAFTINHRIYGEIIYCDSQTSGDLTRGIPPHGKLVCNVRRLPLMPGTYTITIFLKKREEILDWIIDAATLKVVEGNIYDSGKLPPRGLFLITDYSWQVL